MRMYSSSTGGFYSKEVHGTRVPADAVEISDGDYLALLRGQSDGQQIVSDGNGRPVLVDRPASEEYK